MAARPVFSVVSNAEAPEPPYPRDTRAKGWRYEDNYEEEMASDWWMDLAPDLKGAVLLTRRVAWAQTPCGSLPSDLGTLSRRLGYDPQWIERHRDIVLGGWVLHSDGRYYHPDMSAQVLRMIGARDRANFKKQSQRSNKINNLQNNVPRGLPRGVPTPEPEERTNTVERGGVGERDPKPSTVGRLPAGRVLDLFECLDAPGARVDPESPRPLGPSALPSHPSPRQEDPDDGLTTLEAGVPRSHGVADQGSRKTGSMYPPEFEAFWDAYPRKVGKGAALKAWKAAQKRSGKSPGELLERVRVLVQECRDTEQRFIPHPTTWLNQCRFDDPRKDSENRAKLKALFASVDV